MSLSANAQRLDAIGKADPLKISGSFSTNQIAYFGGGNGNGRDPYTLFVTGNLNLDIYGWAVPLGFSISNQSKGRFQQPFNQYSLHPSYKWVTAHVGYTSMSFSSYTLNNHLFSGVGADLAPKGPFKFNLMYGRLQKAVVTDSSTVNGSIDPAFKRMGYGLKGTYSRKRDFLSLILFKAKDDVNSNLAINRNSLITPQENFVSGINISKIFLKKFIITGELGLSALTRNQWSQQDSGRQAASVFAPVLNLNRSTALYTAYKGNLAYGGKKYTVGLGYERVAPEYKTLGAYYFTNDFENITVNVSTKMLKDKLSLAATSGIQHDDLRKDKQSATSRFVGSLNMAYQFNKKLSITTTYSSFQSFVNIRPAFNQINALTPYDNLDTLNYTQISQNINVNANYVLRQDKEKTGVLNANFSLMTSADKQGGNTQNSGGAFYNFNASYSISLVPKNLSINYSLNASTSKGGPMRTTTLGPTIGANRTFFDKKVRSGLSTSWNGSFNEGKPGSSVLNLRINSSYVVKKKHNLNLSMVALSRGAQKTSTRANSRSFREFTTTLGYNYNF
ncbi:MAG: hypothetical protein H7Y13_16225 [Sphingobacteriaceae bacterium]|nr:hypothetical protein [Sphingobacteriaceae bacterium]